MKQNLQEAKEFISHFKNHIIQTFDDKPTKNISLTRCGSLKGKELVELNDKSAGVFFTPNQFIGERKKDKCLGVNAWIAEMDGIPKSEQWQKLLNCPLPPSVIVETRNSYHCYWLAKDGTIENYDRIVRGLIQYFNADPACKDISRVFRIPGFFHNKAEPFMVRIELADWGCLLTEKEMIEAYPYEEKVFKQVVTVNKPIEEGIDFWEAVSRLDNKRVLERISGTYIVNNERLSFRPRTGGGEYIDVNNSPADAWLDAQGMIGSGKGAAPTFVQWLQWYGWTKGDIAKWLKEHCKDMLPESALKYRKPKPQEIAKKVISEQNDDDIAGEFSKETEVFTWGTSRLDREITPIQKNHFIILSGTTGAGKTAFAFDVACKNVKQGKRVLYLSLEMSKKEIIVRVSRAFAGITKEEWRDRSKIPEYKINIAKKKAGEISGEKGLILQGFPDGILPTVESIFAIIEEVNPDLTIVDNFDLISKDGKISEYQEQTRIADEFMTKCHKLERPVIVIHHKNPKSKIQGVGGNRGSGKISDNCNMALAVMRTWDKDASPKDNARFTVVHEKDRDFGGFQAAEVYFRHGTFVDEYEEILPEKFAVLEHWSN